jgi:hypothetical protein
MSNDLRLLNRNIGASNIVDENKINDIMCETLKDLGNLLEDHCGPFGKFAMLPPDISNPLAEPVFTKDGINIVNSVNYLNPIQSITKDMLSYIGKKIDNAAGDGTTSSMLLSTHLLLHFKEYIKDNSDVYYKKFIKAYNNFTTKVIKELDNYSLSIDLTDKDFVYKTSYKQAMTSSHGDKELSELVAELMSNLPKHAWNTLIFEKERKETVDRFKLKIDDSSYSLESYILSNQMLNSDVGTEFIAKDVDLIVTSSELHTNGIEFLNLLQTIKSRTKDDKDLVIITGVGKDSKVVTELADLYFTKRKEGINIIIFRAMILHPVINDLEALYAIGGYCRQDMIDNFIMYSNINLEYKNEILYIYNLVDYLEDGMHPELVKETSPLKSLIHIIEEFLIDIKESRGGVYQQSELPNRAKKIATNCKCKSQGHIVIGGSGYDNRASKDILVDALTSVKESLTHGISLGGYKSLRSAITNFLRSEIININDYSGAVDNENCSEEINIMQTISKIKSTNDIEQDIGTIFNMAINYILELIYIKKSPNAYNEDAIKSLIYSREYNMKSVDVTTMEISDFNKESICDISSSVILQPKSMDIEFLKRFGEVASKFLFANKVLIPDSVNVINEEK